MRYPVQWRDKLWNYFIAVRGHDQSNEPIFELSREAWYAQRTDAVFAEFAREFGTADWDETRAE